MFEALRWVGAIARPECPLTTSEQMVLVALIAHVNARSGACFPGRARLAACAHVSDSTVKRALKRLKELGLVRVTLAGGGRGRRTHYELDPSPPNWAALREAHGLPASGWRRTPKIKGAAWPSRNRVKGALRKGVTLPAPVTVGDQELTPRVSESPPDRPAPHEIDAIMRGLFEPKERAA